MLNIADQVRALEAEHDKLSAKVTLLEATNAELRAENARLLARIATTGATSELHQ